MMASKPARATSSTTSTDGMIEKVASSGVPLLSRSRSAGSVIVPSLKA